MYCHSATFQTAFLRPSTLAPHIQVLMLVRALATPMGSRAGSWRRCRGSEAKLGACLAQAITDLKRALGVVSGGSASSGLRCGLSVRCSLARAPVRTLAQECARWRRLRCGLWVLAQSGAALMWALSSRLCCGHLCGLW